MCIVKNSSPDSAQHCPVRLSSNFQLRLHEARGGGLGGGGGGTLHTLTSAVCGGVDMRVWLVPRERAVETPERVNYGLARLAGS